MTERELFIAALRLPEADARAAFLEGACADERLRQRLESMLRDHEQLGSFLESPAAPPITVESSSLSEGPGTVIGPYKLLEQIGEGGMGVVYMAEQTKPVRRKVSLKIIKPGMDSRQIIARFEAERQALALMDHPNIAQVHDAGTTDCGRPHFVMELVKGIPITDYCDREHLAIDDRLELFVQGCQAVQHAHQKGIIHRDLKPSNILVTLIDGAAVPKIIDFGVAKAIGQQLTEKTLFTGFAQLIGTPLYMSPEQAAFSGVDVDTRSDIYALGVLLYELLTGTTPFDAETLRTAPYDEIRRIIREQEPPKPSTRISTLEATAATISANRQTDPRRLRKALRGELDWIVMKCLEKDRNRRYETANGLAQDVQRYLADEPVEARPPSAGYRFGKFLRRHWRPAIAASLVLLALLVGIAGTTYGLICARAATSAEAEQRAKAVEERDRALAAEARSRAINEFLTEDLLTQAEPANNAPEDKVELLEVLDRAAAKVGQRFAGEPALESALRVTIANTYHGLASWEKAEAQWRSLLDAARQRDPQSAEFYNAQGELAHILHHRGRRDAEVMKMAETAAAGLERTLSPDHADTLATLNNLAVAYREAGRLAEAIVLFERVRDAQTAKLGPDHPGTLTTLSNLAEAYRRAGRLSEAIVLFERVRDAQTAKLGPDHPGTLTTLNNLALAYYSAGKLPEAIALHERVRDTQIAKLGLDHLETLTTLNNLALAYLAANRLPAAIALLERVRDARIAKLGPDHPDALATVGNLAEVYRGAGRLSEAIVLFERVRDARIAKLGPDDPDTLNALNNLATAYWSMKRLDQSVPLFEDVLGRAEAKLGRQHRDTQMTVANLGVNYKDADRLDEAILLLEEAHRASARLPNLRWVGRQLVDAYIKVGRSAEAVKLVQEQLAEVRKILPKDSPQLADVLALDCHVLLQVGSYAEAEPLLRECLAIRERTQPDVWNTFTARSMLGGALLGKKKYAEAEPLLLAGYQGMKQTEATIPLPAKVRLIDALERLVRLYEATGDTVKAKEWQQKLTEAREKKKD
jgi:serine/threonine protein kinase